MSRCGKGFAEISFWSRFPEAFLCVGAAVRPRQGHKMSAGIAGSRVVPRRIVMCFVPVIKRFFLLWGEAFFSFI